MYVVATGGMGVLYPVWLRPGGLGGSSASEALSSSVASTRVDAAGDRAARGGSVHVQRERRPSSWVSAQEDPESARPGHCAVPSIGR